MNEIKTLEDSSISYCHIYPLRLAKKLNFLKGGVKFLLRINLFFDPKNLFTFYEIKDHFQDLKEVKMLNKYIRNTEPYRITFQVLDLCPIQTLVKYLITCDFYSLSVILTCVPGSVPWFLDHLDTDFQLNCSYVPTQLSPPYQLPKVFGGMRTVT